jgi:hypothetical protein
MPLHDKFLAPVFILIGCGITFAADDAPVPIQLFRAEKVGALTNGEIVIDRATTTITTDPNGVATKKTDVKHWEMAGRVEALEVAGKGYTTRSLLTLKKLVDANAAELLPAGTEIEITRGNTVSFARADKGQIPPAALEGLREIFTPRDPDRPTEDEVLGTKEPQKPGASWDIHPDALIRAMAKINVDEKNVSGKSTLKAVETRGDTKVLHIQTQYQCTDVTPKDQPPAQVVEPYKVEYEADIYLPADPAQTVVENRIRTHVQMQITTSDGSKIAVDQEATSRGTFSPVKRGGG